MKNIKVLIAEDDILIAEHLKTILTKQGFVEIEMAHNKKDVIARIIEFLPDIILLDINMDTKRAGIEVAEFATNNFNLPIIYITALSDSKTIEQVLKTNPYSYLIKPFKAIEVITAVKLALKKHVTLPEQNYLFVKDGYVDVRIACNQIYYIKSDKNYLEKNIHCPDKP